MQCGKSEVRENEKGKVDGTCADSRSAADSREVDATGEGAAGSARQSV